MRAEIKKLTWDKERSWLHLFCGTKKVGFAKPSITGSMPFVWFNTCTQESGFSESIEKAQESAEKSFIEFINELTKN